MASALFLGCEVPFAYSLLIGRVHVLIIIPSQPLKPRLGAVGVEGRRQESWTGPEGPPSGYAVTTRHTLRLKALPSLPTWILSQLLDRSVGTRRPLRPSAGGFLPPRCALWWRGGCAWDLQRTSHCTASPPASGWSRKYLQGKEQRQLLGLPEAPYSLDGVRRQTDTRVQWAYPPHSLQVPRGDHVLVTCVLQCSEDGAPSRCTLSTYLLKANRSWLNQ